MRYLSVSPGVSVRVDAIVAVERTDEVNSVVYTNNANFDSIIPYDAILNILGTVEDPKEEAASSLKTLESASQFNLG